MPYYYLDCIESEQKDLILFESPEDRDEWEILNSQKSDFNETPCQIISKGDFNNWVKDRLVTKEKLTKLTRTNKLKKQKIELEKQLKEISQELFENEL